MKTSDLSTKDLEQMKRLKEHAEQVEKWSEVLEKEKPGIPAITLIVMAQDYAGVDRIDKEFREGRMNFKTASTLIGSFARFEWALLQFKNGKVSPETFFEMLPDLWVSSDPDDKSEETLNLWREAKKRNGGIVYDDKRFKIPFSPWIGFIEIFRGQSEDSPFGMSWSTVQDVANRFARGAGKRCFVPGVVYRALVRESNVYAYLNKRGEFELIINPAKLECVELVARWVKKEG